MINKISNLNIPFIISRRGRGSNEINCSICVYYKDIVDEVEVARVFIKYQKKVLNFNIIKDIAHDLKEVSTSFDEVRIEFLLPIDRLSVSLDPSLCVNLKCYYGFNVVKGIFLGIICPIKIDYVFAFLGEVDLCLFNPYVNVYFDDLLDLLQKYNNVVVYPVVSKKDLPLLQEIYSKESFPPEVYIDIIKNLIVKRKICKHASVSLTYTDLYRLYNIMKKEEW